MRKSVYARVRQQVERRGRGAVFVTREMFPPGSRAAVDEALARLAREEVIRHLCRGLYGYPRLHPSSGPSPPIPTQSPSPLRARPAPASRGSARARPTLWGCPPRFPPGPPTSPTAAPAQAGGAVIQALRHLGPDHIDADAVERLRRVLTAREKAAPRREAPGAAAWLAPILQDIARPDEKLGE